MEAFDASGNLWVAVGGQANALVEIANSDLTASGTLTPLAVVSGGGLNTPVAVAFNP